MKITLILVFSSLLLHSSFLKAQSEESNDPKATAILTKVKKLYDGYKSLQMTFKLETQSPDQVITTEKGVLTQFGKKYRIEIPAVTSFSDGKSVWTYLKKKKEIQITSNDGKSATGFISPQEMLRFYEKKDFLYALVGESNHSGLKCNEIEFKPTSKRTEYFKVRIAICKKDNSIKEVKAFYKDGSRYTITVVKQNSNKAVNMNLFTYSKTEWPNIRVEDLRID